MSHWYRLDTRVITRVFLPVYHTSTQGGSVQECTATDRSYAKLVIVTMESGLTAVNKTPQVGYGVWSFLVRISLHSPLTERFLFIFGVRVRPLPQSQFRRGCCWRSGDPRRCLQSGDRTCGLSGQKPSTGGEGGGHAIEIRNPLDYGLFNVQSECNYRNQRNSPRSHWVGPNSPKVGGGRVGFASTFEGRAVHVAWDIVPECYRILWSS